MTIGDRFKKFDLENRITLVYNDALNVELEGEYDLIFIDAAKGKNKELSTTG